MTILAAMQRFKLLPRFQAAPSPANETLRIHLIGAEPNYELVTGSLAAEELLHVLPSVKTLEWIMVRTHFLRW